MLSCLRLAARERAWSRRRAGLALRAWRASAGRSARNMRIVVLRRLARNRQSLAAIFDCWRVLAKARMVQLHLREIHRLQVRACLCGCTRRQQSERAGERARRFAPRHRTGLVGSTSEALHARAYMVLTTTLTTSARPDDLMNSATS